MINVDIDMNLMKCDKEENIMAKRRSGFLTGMDRNLKRKAKNAATQCIYEGLFGEKAPKKRRRVKI